MVGSAERSSRLRKYGTSRSEGTRIWVEEERASKAFFADSLSVLEELVDKMHCAHRSVSGLNKSMPVKFIYRRLAFLKRLHNEVGHCMSQVEAVLESAPSLSSREVLTLLGDAKEQFDWLSGKVGEVKALYNSKARPAPHFKPETPPPPPPSAATSMVFGGIPVSPIRGLGSSLPAAGALNAALADGSNPDSHAFAQELLKDPRTRTRRADADAAAAFSGLIARK